MLSQVYTESVSSMTIMAAQEYGIWDEFNYGREPKIKRITMGDNQGITELVLRKKMPIRRLEDMKNTRIKTAHC